MTEKPEEPQFCENPWKSCENTDIELYIMYEGQKKAICRQCWEEISESEVEWFREHKTA